MPVNIPYIPPLEDPEIIYIDDDIIVVNKPSGLLSVPGRGADKQDCVLSRLQCTNPEALIVHRLDMPTSGILVLARSPKTHRQISKLFQERNVNKEYTTIVQGVVRKKQGEINLPLITDWPNRPKQKVDHENGKPSLTHYEILSVNTKQQTTRLKLTPITGRSHQLRVHLLSIGHVITGDALYSKDEAEKNIRLQLHANKIAFSHPSTNKILTINSNVPF